MTKAVEALLSGKSAKKETVYANHEAPKEPLSVLIRALNERYGIEFTEADKVWAAQQKQAVKDHDNLRAIALNNDEGNFRRALQQHAEAPSSIVTRRTRNWSTRSLRSQGSSRLSSLTGPGLRRDLGRGRQPERHVCIQRASPRPGVYAGRDTNEGGSLFRSELLSGTGLWEDLAPRLNAKGSTYAAIAFVGSESPRLLPLAKGDLLVVNAGDATLRSGGSSPKALQSFRRRGVEIWSDQHLHAKVLATARGVCLVGSANASSNSSNLHEAVMTTSDPQVRRQVREFVRSLVGHSQAVDAAFLERAKKLYQSPRAGARVGDDSPRPTPFSSRPDRLIIVDWADWDPTVETEDEAKAEIRRLPRIAGWRYASFGWATPRQSRSLGETPLSARDVLIWNKAGHLEPPQVVQNLSTGNAVRGRAEPFGVSAALTDRDYPVETSRLPLSLRSSIKESEYVVVEGPQLIDQVLGLWGISLANTE